MRTQYRLDDMRRGAAGAVQRLLARERAERGRRARWAGVAGACVLGAAALGAWLWLRAQAPEAVPAPAAAASVPEHQRTGPLANPWGNGPLAAGEPGAEARGAASAPATGPATLGGGAAPDAGKPRPGGATALATAAGRDALKAALAQWRGSARASDFVKTALQASTGDATADAARLAIAWMAERQCRALVQWRLAATWRQRAMNPSAAVDPTVKFEIPGASPTVRNMLARCEGMPEDTAVDSALAAAGFAATDPPEPTRRPIELATAAAVGDPTLLANVLDALSPEDLSTWVSPLVPARGLPAESFYEVRRAALWLASCRAPADARAAAAQRQACQEHPAVWQACMQRGLCDIRDLNDLVLRTLPADQWQAADRLAQVLAPKLGH